MSRHAQWGDFPTPLALARRICAQLVQEHGFDPEVVVEPTCGSGAFLIAAAEAFPRARLIGVEIDADHVAAARAAVRGRGDAGARSEIIEADVFSLDWGALLKGVRGPILALGNPPWVTTDAVRRRGGANGPRRRNVWGHGGLEAMTGAGTFDLSEAVLLSLAEHLGGRDGVVAMLCKVAVARRFVALAARRTLQVEPIGLWTIDAKREFGASVAAGLFLFRTGAKPAAWSCPVAPLSASDEPQEPRRAFGLVDGVLVADVEAAARWRSIAGDDGLEWRSGLKHDCADVMELRAQEVGGRVEWVNGLGEPVEIEDSLTYPLLSGTDVRRGRVEAAAERRVLVTQRTIGAPTEEIARAAPKTWAYLEAHRERLERRASRVWRGRPDFSIFGVGPYAFAPHKVVVCGLDRRLRFVRVGPVGGRPVMVDDTCYALGFEDEGQARAAVAALRSDPAGALLRSMMFDDAKRPVTKRLLERVHLGRLADHLLAAGGLPGVAEAELRALRDLASRRSPRSMDR